MNKTLRALYNRFYKRPELAALNESVAANHRLLIARLAGTERKLVLRIIDDEAAIVGALSLDAFLCGCRLAWQLSNELNNLDEERSVLADEAERSVLFYLKKEETTMKKLLTITLVIAACAALYAPVWPRMDAGEELPAAAVEMRTAPVCAEIFPEQRTPAVQTETAEELMAEKEEVPATEVVTTPAPTEAPEPESQAIEAESETPAPTPQSAPAASDPYHTDVYPNNVYSEELIYNEDGNLIGKTATIPTAFGSDTIWIDGHAYYDVPGFGLVEWSGPNQRIEDYTMYESGVKVGIMGDGDESPANRPASASQPEDWPEPTGEVIDQTITAAPERGNTPPDYKPDLMPPDDPNARVDSVSMVGCVAEFSSNAARMIVNTASNARTNSGKRSTSAHSSSYHAHCEVECSASALYSRWALRIAAFANAYGFGCSRISFLRCPSALTRAFSTASTFIKWYMPISLSGSFSCPNTP